MTTKRGEQLLAQGERTRTRLLEVAVSEIAANSDVSLSQIARAAGVGIGTLYRHFPTRETLVFEVYRGEVRHLAESAAELLDSRSPIEAFRIWLDRFAQYSMTKTGLLAALHAASHGEWAQAAYRPVTEAIDLLLAANARAGTLRADVTADDVLFAVGGLYLLDPSTDWQPLAARILDFVVEGFRP